MWSAGRRGVARSGSALRNILTVLVAAVAGTIIGGIGVLAAVIALIEPSAQQQATGPDLRSGAEARHAPAPTAPAVQTEPPARAPVTPITKLPLVPAATNTPTAPKAPADTKTLADTKTPAETKPVTKHATGPEQQKANAAPDAQTSAAAKEPPAIAPQQHKRAAAKSVPTRAAARQSPSGDSEGDNSSSRATTTRSAARQSPPAAKHDKASSVAAQQTTGETSDVGRQPEPQTERMTASRSHSAPRPADRDADLRRRVDGPSRMVDQDRTDTARDDDAPVIIERRPLFDLFGPRGLFAPRGWGGWRRDSWRRDDDWHHDDGGPGRWHGDWDDD